MTIFETFRLNAVTKHNDTTLNAKWNDLPEATLCATPVYAKFAKFLIEDYLQPGGEFEGKCGGTAPTSPCTCRGREGPCSR